MRHRDYCESANSVQRDFCQIVVVVIDEEADEPNVLRRQAVQIAERDLRNYKNVLNNTGKRTQTDSHLKPAEVAVRQQKASQYRCSQLHLKCNLLQEKLVESIQCSLKPRSAHASGQQQHPIDICSRKQISNSVSFALQLTV